MLVTLTFLNKFYCNVYLGFVFAISLLILSLRVTHVPDRDTHFCIISILLLFLPLSIHISLLYMWICLMVQGFGNILMSNILYTQGWSFLTSVCN